MNQSGPIIVTIDGPAGTGKSTVARLVANELEFDFLDTGAMYRAAALLAIEGNLGTSDGQSIAQALESARISFDWSTDPPRVQLNEPVVRDVSDKIRTPDVTEAVSPVSACPEVREVLVKEQQRIGREHPRLVTEGRDQGSVVFPDAMVRIFLDASPEVRAQRRADQWRAEGREVDEEEIRIAIIHRDESDRNRAVGPLTVPEGAIIVDSSDLSRDEVVAEIVGLVREHLGIGGYLNP